jgi:hypothetical protein
LIKQYLLGAVKVFHFPRRQNRRAGASPSKISDFAGFSQLLPVSSVMARANWQWLVLDGKTKSALDLSLLLASSKVQIPTFRQTA